MLTLINTNRMVPPIAPVGLDYIAATARRAGIAVELVDLGLAKDPDAALHRHFSQHRPELVGLSFRNVDDCFWPSGQSFLPELQNTVASETKRGCARKCVYCADPLAKGTEFRLRPPADVVNELKQLVGQGIDTFHLCDAEFNLPPQHALDVCNALIAGGLGNRIRWYAYLAVTPFSGELAGRMSRAGCVGINFTSDAAHAEMLATYGQPHRREHLDRAVRLCRENHIAVMLDMLLGGPGETHESLAETIAAFQQINPDCAGAALGIRLYPGTPVAKIVAAEGPFETNPSIRRHYQGSVDLLQPTFYISSTLGDHPARLVRDLIGDDPRFFPPEEEASTTHSASGDHNYNANQQLADAIAAGERGAYWDILRRLQRM